MDAILDADEPPPCLIGVLYYYYMLALTSSSEKALIGLALFIGELLGRSGLMQASATQHIQILNMQNQQPPLWSQTLKFTACTLYLEAVIEGWKTHISLFSRTGWQKGCWSDLTWARSSNCSRRAVFTLNQTFPPRPLAARPGSINMGLIHFLCSPLQLDRWSMKAGTWERSSKQQDFAGKCKTPHRFQPSLACGDEEMAPANPRKRLFPQS